MGCFLKFPDRDVYRFLLRLVIFTKFSPFRCSERTTKTLLGSKTKPKYESPKSRLHFKTRPAKTLFYLLCQPRAFGINHELAWTLTHIVVTLPLAPTLTLTLTVDLDLDLSLTLTQPSPEPKPVAANSKPRNPDPSRYPTSNPDADPNLNPYWHSLESYPH